MRFYRQILLVVALAIGMIASGVAWVRFYVSPQVEQAQRRPDPPPSVADDLPAGCLEELSSMGQPSAETRRRSERPTAAAKGSIGETSSVGDDVSRAGSPASPGGPNRIVTQIQVSEPSAAATGRDATVRPIHHAQSADWAEPVTQAAGLRGQRPVQVGAMSVSALDSAPQNDLPDALKSVDVLDLMRRLRADDSDQKVEARRELARRGFSEVDLELARQLFSPDAETRKQLARAVPRLSSVDAAQWLMWLALDPQPEVRLAAMTTLATTGDPALLDRVEAMARSDHDPQIQALANQIAKQRDLASSRGDSTEARPRR